MVSKSYSDRYEKYQEVRGVQGVSPCISNCRRRAQAGFAMLPMFETCKSAAIQPLLTKIVTSWGRNWPVIRELG